MDGDGEEEGGTDLGRGDVDADLAQLVLLLEVYVVAEAVEQLALHDAAHGWSKACCGWKMGRSVGNGECDVGCGWEEKKLKGEG